MCGISGMYCLAGVSDEHEAQVSHMSELLKHRGPDGSGLHREKTCILAHRRLAVIDLSKDGAQPFFSDNRQLILAYNGEIYNYIELRKELISAGVVFRTNTDTEVVLRAYEHWGINCLTRFNGMFAIAIFNAPKNELFIARDRLGIKPLYYRDCGEEFYIASEIKALTSLKQPLSLHEPALFDFLAFNRTDVSADTMFAEIKRLPKGCYGYLNADGLSITPWWLPTDYISSNSHLSIEEVSESIQKILTSAIEVRMRSDVPVGSCLSGGLDSSILCGILFKNNLAKEGYPTFTASFPDHPIDETSYVDQLKQQYPFENYRTYPTADIALDMLEDFLYFNDEPTTSASFFTQFLVMKLAKEHGVTVLLDGQGGDECFAGYQYFHGFNLYGLLHQGRIRTFLKELCGSIYRQQHISAYQTLAFKLLPRSFKKKLIHNSKPFIDHEFFDSHISHSKVFNEFFNAADLNSSLALHFQFKLEHLLRSEDRNSMAFSLEARVPYLDHRLVELILSTQGDYKIQNGETKYLQKRALKQFTIKQIHERKDKIGFGTPVENWMRNDKWVKRIRESIENLSSTFPEILKVHKLQNLNPTEQWKLVQLDAWARQL